MSAQPRLVVVSDNNLPDPPYPAEIRARGWRFEIELERVKRSDTWKLTPAEIRPWLFMLWAEAWLEHPVGTLPADDRLIAATIEMPLALFQAHREVLMRGWYRCADGRLYHPVLCERVEEMIALRQKDAARVRAWRERGKQAVSEDVTRNKRGRTGEFDTHHPLPTTTKDKDMARASRTPPSVDKKKKRPTEGPIPDDFGVSERVRKYCEQNGIHDPEKYAEILVGRAKAKGKLYADWDQVLINAIREDWYGLRKPDAAVPGRSSSPGWWTSEAGILAKGRELGLQPRPGETTADFRGRINAKLDRGAA
jgi:hypothetical protein